MNAVGDIERRELVKEHTPLVWSIVRRYMGRGVEPEDLFQIGAIGLIKAIDGFDQSMGTRFSTYAVPKIMGEIKRFLRDDGPIKISRTVKENAYAVERARADFLAHTGREPTVSEISGLTGVMPEDIAVCQKAPSSVASLDAALSDDGGSLMDIVGDGRTDDDMAERQSLYDAIGHLEPELRKVIALRFFRDMTQQKAAAVIGCSQVRVSRLEKKAIGQLRELLEVR